MGPVDSNENITRYLFQKDQFNRQSQSLNPAAFIPSKKETPRSLSVFRTKDLTDRQIWDTGIEEVESKRDRSLKARGDTIVKKILDSNLSVVPETSQHERHADIINWPLEEHKILEIASKLALKATLHIKPIS